MVGANPVQETRIFKSSPPDYFCKSCSGQLSVSMLNKHSNGTCPNLPGELVPVIKRLRRGYKESEENMKELKAIMFEREKSPDDLHRINITYLSSDSKLKKFIRWRNDLEYLVHLTYARVTVLATYLELAARVYKQDLTEEMKNKITNIENQLRISSCRLYELITKFQLRKIPKKLCKFTKKISISSDSDGVDYMLSVGMHGVENIERILRGLDELKEVSNNCVLSRCEKRVVIKCDSGAKRSTRNKKTNKKKKNRRRHRRCSKNKRKDKRGKNKSGKRCRRHKKHRSQRAKE